MGGLAYSSQHQKPHSQKTSSKQASFRKRKGKFSKPVVLATVLKNNSNDSREQRSSQTCCLTTHKENRLSPKDINKDHWVCWIPEGIKRLEWRPVLRSFRHPTNFLGKSCGISKQRRRVGGFVSYGDFRRYLYEALAISMPKLQKWSRKLWNGLVLLVDACFGLFVCSVACEKTEGFGWQNASILNKPCNVVLF